METIMSDRTYAEALRIAENWLIHRGWKFTPADVGKRAREILVALGGDPS